MCLSSHRDPSVSVQFSSLLRTRVPLPLLDDSPLEHSPIRSRLHSESPVSLWSPTHTLTTSQSPRLPTSTSPSLLSATLSPHCDLSTLLSRATPSLHTRSVSCGGCWHVRFSGSVEPSHVNPSGMLLSICSSTVTLRRLRRKSKRE
uniref:Uncharacterized protein n=1 Tax=Cacopsylla melanoneura TaxID=428564 RepID=A0A8D8VHH4_9HEMI